MSDAHYARIRDIEQGHWWFVATRRLVQHTLEREGIGVGDRVLDAGSGAGGLLHDLPPTLGRVGLEYNASRVVNSFERGDIDYVRGSVDGLPFADDAFDAVVSMDVLSHSGVADDAGAMADMHRVLEPDGLVIVHLAAYEWLRSAHDVAAATGHRYTAKEVRSLLERAGFRDVRVTYRMTFFFPVVAAIRLVRRGGTQTDVRPVRPWINRLLVAILDAESKLLSLVRLPFGLSVYATARARVVPDDGTAAGDAALETVDEGLAPGVARSDRRRRRVRGAVGMAVSVGLLVLMFARLDVGQIVASLENTVPWLFAIALVFGLGETLTRGVRWHRLLKPMAPVSIGPAMSTYFVSNTANMLAPVRAGDVLRAKQVADHTGVAMSRVLSAVAIERVIDAVILLSAFWIGVARVPAEYRSVGIIVAAIATAAIAAGIPLMMRLSRHPEGASRRRAFLARHATELRAGLTAWSASPKAMASGIAWSVVAWGVTLLAMWVALLSINVRLSLLAFVVPMVLFQLVSVLPSGPAFIGTAQAVAVVSLRPFGVSAEDAVAGAFVYQAIFVLASLVWGAWAVRYRRRMGSLTNRKEPSRGSA